MTKTKAEQRRIDLAQKHLTLAGGEIKTVEGLVARHGGTPTLAEVLENWRGRWAFWARQVARLEGK